MNTDKKIATRQSYGEDLKEGYDLINPLDSLVRKKKIEKEETRKRKEKK